MKRFCVNFVVFAAALALTNLAYEFPNTWQRQVLRIVVFASVYLVGWEHGRIDR